MDSVWPFVIFGLWVAFIGVLLLVNRRALARQVRERVTLFGGPHQWREVSALEFPALRMDFYDECQAGLERCGFKLLGDMEDATLRGTGLDPNSFRRVMLSADGLAVAEFWEVNYRPWKRLFRMVGGGFGDGRCLRIFSEAEDGRIFSVERIPEGLREMAPEKFDVRYNDGGVVEDLWSAFRGDMGAFGEWGFAARRFRVLGDVTASEERQQSARVEMRKTTGLLTPAELKRMGMAGGAADSYARAFGKELKRQGGWPPV